MRFDARLTKLEAAYEPPDDRPGPGLAAMLDYARRHPPAAPEEDTAAVCEGLARLLAEARQWQAQR